MTRFLSDSLQAPEPLFRHGLRELEAANGSISNDIRLTLDVMKHSKDKLNRLNIDPDDTTPQELYYLLQENVRQADAKLIKNLRSQAATYVSAEADVVSGIVHALNQSGDSKRCFALKPSSFKSVIKQLPPKKAMKQLGYRSLDSFLKHESAPSILVAARFYEGERWNTKLLEQYKKLRSNDFEDRNISIIKLDEGKWHYLAKFHAQADKHNVISLKELGALVFLPLPSDVPSGTVTASLLLGLHQLNEIRACGTYLKLCQVRADFGDLVQAVVVDEPRLSSIMLDMPLPWNLVQRYYAKLKDFKADFADPHLHLEDIAWHPVEKALASIEPAFEAWMDSSHLGILHNHKPISLNLIDAALNLCNQLPYERRITQYFQRSLWHELMMRYLKQDSIERTVMRELQPKLVMEAIEV